jgi:DNA-binding beta-propeller fold protein YncE
MKIVYRPNGLIMLCLFMLALGGVIGNSPSAQAAVEADYAPLVGSAWSLSIEGVANPDTVDFEQASYTYDGDVYLDCVSAYNGQGYSWYNNGDGYFRLFFYSGSYWYVYFLTLTNADGTPNKSGRYTIGALQIYDSAWNLLLVYNVAGVRTDSGGGPVTVKFHACPVGGRAPLTVQFTNDSEGSATSWAWEFGDGATSTAENPSHTYTVNGNYTVKLTATNNSGSTSKTRTDYIRVSDTEEAYRFERMWPNLMQPWYFSGVRGLAKDRTGNIYVVNSWKNRVVKLTSDGQFITNFGSNGKGDGQFLRPYGVAVDASGYIYVTDEGYDSIANARDYSACRVQKFDNTGKFISSWKKVTSDSDVLKIPTGISVDNDGNILVADSENLRIVKYSPSGQFIAQLNKYGTTPFGWPVEAKAGNNGSIYVVDQGAKKVHQFNGFSNDTYARSFDGSETGTAFNKPNSVDFDLEGNLYVADYAYQGNNRIVKVNAVSGQAASLIDNGMGAGDGEFWGPFGVVVDKAGYLYVGAYWDGGISKFTTAGQFINKWHSGSDRPGFFYSPHAIAVDAAGNIYVADSLNYRIQKLDPSGNFVKSWGKYGTGNGEFGGIPDSHQGPHAVALDPISGNVYVADTLNNRIQMFDSSGNYLDQLGGLTRPSGLAFDGAGNFYVAEWSAHRIKKFDKNKNQLAVWGSQGSSDGQFQNPHGIAVDADGYVYVADANNNRIQVFDANGNFEGKWGTFGQEDGQLNQPWDVAIDSDGNVLVADTYNDRVQKFTPNGCFISRLGQTGSLPGQFAQPQSIAVGPDGALFVLETTNNRIQKFKKTLFGNSKAIIVAGGGPYHGNNIWDATRVNANFAYRTLAYQGFTKEKIYYLTPETGLDLDNNGLGDDVDGDATLANIQYGITTWAADATNLIIYLVDHGGSGSFRVNEKEILTAASLKGWVDSVQASIAGKVIIIYDACESGSFLPSLIPPSGKDRISISSATSTQSAYFVSQGAISFSNYFWTSVFNGSNLNVAFSKARDAIKTAVARQTPLLDDNGNGVGNEAQDGVLASSTSIGNGIVIQEDTPAVGSVSAQAVAGTSSAQLTADNVTDSGGVARVWAVITPPGYSPAASDNTIHELPSCDLMAAGSGRFESVCAGFYFPGEYQLDFYAMDRAGNTSAPVRTSVTVTDPKTRKAIIVAGGALSDSVWPAVEQNAKVSYSAMKFQGYPDDSIYYLSAATLDPSVDAPATLANLENAVKTWAKNNTHDVVLYMTSSGLPGNLRINASETLHAANLDAWLDELQGVIPGTVAVICDASGFGSFLPTLTPSADKKRILISSTSGTQAAASGADGAISFSRFFWEQVFKGVDLWDAFLYARTAIEAGNPGQTPKLDDDGNGTPNESTDGGAARDYTIGMGIKLSGNEPQTGDVVADVTLNGATSAEIWIDNVSSTNAVDKVYAVITPPSVTPTLLGMPVPDLPVLVLTDRGSGRYSGIYNGFTTYGTYCIAIYVKDNGGNVSVPKQTTVFQAQGPDMFEEDDSFSKARVIGVDAGDAQRHNFHDQGDQDWVMFYGVAGESYDFKTENVGANSHTNLTLYGPDGTTVVQTTKDDTYVKGELRYLLQCPADGIYYLKGTQYDPSVFGLNTEYDLTISRPVGPAFPGWLTGTVANSQGLGIGGAVIRSNLGNVAAISLDGGYFMMVVPAGTHTLTVTATGYHPYTQGGIQVQESAVATRDIVLTALVGVQKGDFNGDSKVDLADAVLGLRMLAGETPQENVKKEADVNGDGKIGLQDLLFILQKAAGLR